MSDGLHTFIGVREGEIDEDIASAWASSVTCASEQMGKVRHEFEWSAIIGVKGEGRSGNRFGLGKEFDIGSFRIAPSSRSLTHIGRNLTSPSLAVATTMHSWPLLVRSVSSGYNWPSASAFAARDLRQLCALLSLHSEYHTWTVLEAPALISWGERKVPECGYAFYTRPPDGDLQQPPEAPDGYWAPSDWLFNAWQMMTTRLWLARAVTMQHEGQMIEEEHPSLAGVAYTSAIEAIANRMFVEEKCAACNGHLHIAENFRNALKLVLPEHLASVLGKSYGLRSRSVHQAVLHGSETTPGQFGVSWTDPQLAFDLQIVLGLRNASRDLLILALKNQLPRKAALNPSAE
jgi:hypothetical protein